jgi:uncharacterized repeat protein (TIGR01451 family)
VLAAALVAALTAAPASAQVWAPQTSGTGSYLNNVHFTSDSTGWASGAQATLLRTTNGGSQWTAATNTGVGTTQGFNSVRFVDPSNGFAGGLYAVTRTENAGSSWNTGTYSTQYFRNSHFPVSTTVCWAAGGGNDPGSGLPCRSYFRQTWTGSTWQVNQWNYCASGSPIGMDVFMLDADNGWVAGTAGTIYRITSGSGTPTFTAQTSGTAQQLNAVQMLDSSVGWVVGNGGVLLRTTNGGTTWTPGSTGVTGNLSGVHFLDATTGWVVGAGGVILASTDGGATWSPEASGVTVALASIYCPSAAACYAVGQNGTILKRTGITAYADLEVTKTDGSCYALPGGSTSYTITVLNHGPDPVAGATVTDSFPAELSVSGGSCSASAGGSCGWPGGGNINDTVTIPAGGWVVYTAPAWVAAGATGMLVNQASAAVPTGTGDPVPGNNQAEDVDFLELPLFCDGFDSGGTTFWSGAVP